MVLTNFLAGIGYYYYNVAFIQVSCLFTGRERLTKKCFTLLRCGNSSALLPTTLNIFPRCCQQCRKMFQVVAYNANHFSTLEATTRKSALISVHVCFSALLPTTQIIFPRCRPQDGKIICVVAYNMEKRSALLATTQKNVRIRLSPRIRNHIRINTRVSIRGLG